MKTLPNLPTPDMALDGIANRLRDKYWLRKERTMPHDGKRNPTWHDLAKEISARMIEPTDFIDAQFSEQFRHASAPRPRDLKNLRAFDIHRQYMAENRDRFVHELRVTAKSFIGNFKTQIVYYADFAELSLELALDQVFRETLGKHPLLQYLYISGCNVANKATFLDALFADASIQYMLRQEIFDEALETLIPDKFREQAVEAYLKMFGHQASQ